MDFKLESRVDSLAEKPLENEITEQDWSLAQDELNKLRNNDWPKFFELAANLKEAFPERTGEIELYNEDVSTDGWQEVARNMDSKKRGNHPAEFFKIAEAVVRVFPERADYLREHGSLDKNFKECGLLDLEAEKEMQETLDECRKDGDWAHFLENVGRCKTLFPDMLAGINLTEEEKEDISRRVDKSKKPDRGQFFCKMANAALDLGIEVDISDEDLERIKHDFSSAKKSSEKSGKTDWVSFAADLNKLVLSKNRGY